MELLTEDGKIAERIQAIKPTRIATAYIGLDWQEYVDVATLESVVLSPTVGSNPKAIRQLVDVLTFNKVHFLDRLHAKFYWSADAAVLGSSNLSNNGLQGAHQKGLVEAAIAITVAHEPQAHADLQHMHARIEAEAKKNYKTTESKWAQLKALEEQLERLNRANGKALLCPTKKHTKGTALSDFTYDPEMQRIHIAGWSEELTHNTETFKQGMVEYSSEGVAHAQIHYIGVQLKDALQVGDWVLFWEATKDGLKPKRGGPIEWLKVDTILQDSADSDLWRKVGYEVYAREAHEVPFVLDDTVKNAFRQLIAGGKFGDLFLATDEEGWSLNRADAQVAPFLKELKAKVATA